MFGISDYPAFVVAVIVFLAIPGPGNLALIASTGKGGMRAGLACALGLMSGDQILLWMAVAGVATVLTTLPTLFGAIQWVGALYLAWLGWKMLTARPGDAPVLKMRTGHYFRQGMAITLLNPKAIVFYMAFFPLFVNPDTHRGLISFAAMAVTIAILSFAYCATMVSIVHHLAERLRGMPRLTRWLERIAGAMLIGFGIRLAL
jgi:threonine/homoserine/homoserine lactone efflux protein